MADRAILAHITIKVSVSLISRPWHLKVACCLDTWPP